MRFAALGFIAVVLFGCSAKDRDSAMTESKGLAKSLWIRASKQAETITADASEQAINAATAQMEKLSAQLGDIKMPTEVDKLRLASVEEQIERLRYALDMKDVQAKMKAKVDSFKVLVSNTNAKEAEIRAMVAKADGGYRQLQADYEMAKKNFEAAQTRIDDVRKRILDAGGIVP